MSMLFRTSRSIFAAAVLAVAALSSGMAAAADLVVKHKQGELTLSETPKKVLVFDLASLDTLTPHDVFARRLAQEALEPPLQQALTERYRSVVDALTAPNGDAA